MTYLRTGFFITLFAWISFLAQPLQFQYILTARIILGALFLVLLLEKNNLKTLFNLSDWPLWLFLIAMFSGTISVTEKNLAVETYIYLSVNMFFLFYIGKALFNSEKGRITVSAVICIFSLIVALIGIFEVSCGKNILYANFIANPYYERYIDSLRPMSTLLNPVVLGSYLLGCLPFNVYLFKHKSAFLRILSVLSAILGISVLLLTFSRGIFLGLAALVLFYLWKSGKKFYFKIFIFCLVLLVLICSFQKDNNISRLGFKRLISGSYDSAISEYRFSRVKMAVQMFGDHPFCGTGFNHFRIKFNQYCEKKDIQMPDEFRVPDSMYLTFLSETGLAGSAGFLIFLGVLLKRGFKGFRNFKSGEKKLALLVALSALVGLLVNMGAFELFYWANPYMIFCLICGFIWGLTEKEELA